MKNWLLAAIILVMAQSALAKVYKCNEGGAVVFRDQPCSAGATGGVIDVKPNVVEKSKSSTVNTSNNKTGIYPADQNIKKQNNAQMYQQQQRAAQEKARQDANAQLTAKCKAQRGTDCGSQQALERERIKATPMSQEQRRALRYENSLTEGQRKALNNARNKKSK